MRRTNAPMYEIALTFHRRLSATFLALVLTACTSPSPARSGETDAASATTSSDAGVPDADAAPPPTVRVLFIGNSYTEVNDLPAVVANLSQASQSPMRIAVAKHTPGGQTWEGHNADPAVDTLIRQGWDYVVLQDQSAQSFPGFGIGVKSALLSLNDKIKATSAKTVLYMTWARKKSAETDAAELQYFQQAMSVNHYYQWHAEVAGTLVAPVGRAWERAGRDPKVALYADDGSHPNAQGTYLAACVFYATLTGQTPVGLGNGGLTVSDTDTSNLQRIAWETMVARERPAPPLLGEWPLSNKTSGNDLAFNSRLVLGDVAGPQATPSSATQFGNGRYAAIPYFTGLNSPKLTLSFYAYRADWSASIVPEQYLVAKWQAYEVVQKATKLSAQVHTKGDASPTPITFDVGGLAAGWHHIAMTYDGSAYALWIDKVSIGSGTTSGDIVYPGSASLPYGSSANNDSPFTGFAVGSRPANVIGVLGDVSTFTGELAGLRLYERALTAGEIQGL